MQERCWCSYQTFRLGGVIGPRPFWGNNMLNESTIKEVLKALSDAGLCVCESNLIGQCHPGLLTNHEYVIGRVEESGGLSD